MCERDSTHKVTLRNVKMHTAVEKLIKEILLDIVGLKQNII